MGEIIGVNLRKMGCFPDLSNEEYHADPAISRSGIMKFKESPFKYWAEYLNPNRPPKKSTPQMEFGSAFHTYVLEPEKFLEQYVMEPPKVLLKDVGREIFDAHKAYLASLADTNKIIITDDEWLLLGAMRDALQSREDVWPLIEGALAYESSYFWQDEESGLWLKCRPDILHENMIVDLKTCVSASTRAYQHAMVDGGLHIQAAMVREGVNVVEGRDIPNAINLCIEKKYPYSIGIKMISEAALEQGRLEFKATLLRMAECFAANDWPDIEVEMVDLPAWY